MARHEVVWPLDCAKPRWEIWAMFGQSAEASSRCMNTSVRAGACIASSAAPPLIVMLGGGDKSTQPADIAKAIKLAATLEDCT